MMPGWPELLLVLVIVLVVFGAGRLPQVFEAMGDGIRRFREAQEGDDEEPAAKQLAERSSATPAEADEVESKVADA